MNELSLRGGNVTRSLVVNFQIWRTLTARLRFSPPSIINNSRLLEFEIQQMHIVFVRLYFAIIIPRASTETRNMKSRLRVQISHAL